MSLPSRERGLKLYSVCPEINPRRVAPFTGAWIEIFPSGTSEPWPRVAPFTGAWIEMTPTGDTQRRDFVAPFTGAWIEIISGERYIARAESLPSRERGLKFDHVESAGYHILSLPSRERGLK